GVDRRVGLDQALVGTVAGLDRPIDAADDAGGDGVLEAVWVADRDGPLARTEGLGAAERGDRQAAAGDADERHVAGPVRADAAPALGAATAGSGSGGRAGAALTASAASGPPRHSIFRWGMNQPPSRKARERRQTADGRR